MRNILLEVLEEVKRLLSGSARLQDCDKYGQTMQDEWEEVGRLQCDPNFQLARSWDDVVQDVFGTEEGHGTRKLYGGAQYGRMLEEFRCG